MLRIAIMMSVVALFLAMLGFGGLDSTLVDITVLLFWVAVIIAAILFVLNFIGARKLTG